MIHLRVGVVVLAMTLLGAAGFQEKGKEKKAEDPPTKLKGTLPANFKKLGLTDNQVQKIYKIRNDYRVKQEELKRKMEQLKTEEKDTIEKVLTPEQRKRLREIRAGEKGEDK